VTVAPTHPTTTTGSRAAEALRRHAAHHGKIQTAPKVPIGPGDFGIWYTPGVAAPCTEIRDHPDLVYEYTNKGNSVAIVTDGSRILGLGDIGPEAGLPVMEGKALLFKYLGGVDAMPLCLAVESPEELIRTVEIVAPSFGGVNLEDIRQPVCFQVLDTLRRRLPVPVWHDDQQGTAMVAVAALVNALRLVGKDLASIRIAMIGMGAANVATFRLLRAMGVARDQVVACDSRGILHPERADIEFERHRFPDKWRICTSTNPDGRTGGIAEALMGADVCLAFSRSGPDVIRPVWVERMAPNAIVFACANPVPEIWPRDAHAAGARIVATGSSDLPNQVNNSLAFPGVFPRGARRPGPLDPRRARHRRGSRSRRPRPHGGDRRGSATPADGRRRGRRPGGGGRGDDRHPAGTRPGGGRCGRPRLPSPREDRGGPGGARDDGGRRGGDERLSRSRPIQLRSRRSGRVVSACATNGNTVSAHTR
jgi:malate dehydrogenase (oxaloacetate-decarboxylating)